MSYADCMHIAIKAPTSTEDAYAWTGKPYIDLLEAVHSVNVTRYVLAMWRYTRIEYQVSTVGI